LAAPGEKHYLVGNRRSSLEQKRAQALSGRNDIKKTVHANASQPLS
jgi:hypothetical protein